MTSICVGAGGEERFRSGRGFMVRCNLLFESGTRRRPFVPMIGEEGHNKVPTLLSYKSFINSFMTWILCSEF